MSNKYKINQTQIGINTVQTIIATTPEGKLLHIPLDEGNLDFQQFLKDVVDNGITCVEGADVETEISYVDARKSEYPPLEEQLDQIYHSGIDAWKADIKAIKDKYPKQTMDTTELQKRKDTAIFNLQKRDYEKAVARLAQYELSAGKKGVVGTENVWDDKSESYIDQDIIGYVIQPLPLIVDGVRNPLVVADKTERAAAQTVINNTPQAVIDSINT